MRIFQGVAADSFLAVTAREWERLGDARLSNQIRTTGRRLALVRDSIVRARPRPGGADAVIEPDDGSDGGEITTSPPGTFSPEVYGTPTVTIEFRDDVAIVTLTALIRGTHLHADLNISATNESGEAVVPQVLVVKDVQNSEGIAACFARIPGCLVGTVRVVTEIRGLLPCGVTVSVNGSVYAFNSSYSISVGLKGIISVSPSDLGQGIRILVPNTTASSPKCTPPSVHIRVQGTSYVYEGGTLYDTVPAGQQFMIILDGTKTTEGNTPNVSYAWFADGSKISENIAATHYPAPGRHEYELRVRNKAGLEGRASAKLVLAERIDSVLIQGTSDGGGGGGDDAGNGGSWEGTICYDWYWYYPETDTVAWFAETCGNEPPPSEINMTTRMPSSTGALSFSMTAGGAQARRVTMVLSDDVPAGATGGGALYSPPGSADAPYLLIPSTATPKDIAAALELARRSLEYPVRANTLVRLKRFTAGDRWLGGRLPAAGKLLSDLRSAPVRQLGRLGAHRALSVPIDP